MAAFDVIYAILAYTAGVCSFLMNAAPIAAITSLEKSGTIGSGTITFYGAQMYNSVCWSTYGVFNWNLPLLIPNALGNAVASYSTLVFLATARREEKSGKKLPSTTYTKSVLTSIFFLALSWIHLFVCIVLLMQQKGDVARSLTGWEATVASVVMLSSPLGVFKEIVRTKNAESLQPLMVCFAFFNTLLWSIAGMMVLDLFIVVPNFLCFLACVAQIVLLVKYGRRPPDAKVEGGAIAAVPFD